MLTTYYDTLEVSRKASDAVIRASYRALSQRYHPDKNLDDLDAAHRDMKRLNEAYVVLSDPVRRAAYDDAVGKKEQEVRAARSRAEFQTKSERADAPQAPPPVQARRDVPESDRTEPRNVSPSRSDNADGESTTRQYRQTYEPAPARSVHSRITDRIGNFGFGAICIGFLTNLAIWALLPNSFREAVYSPWWITYGLSSLLCGWLYSAASGWFKPKGHASNESPAQHTPGPAKPKSSGEGSGRGAGN
jgi:hypothetical protein